MKDELLKILKSKLDHLNNNIKELNDLNDKLNFQNESLSYIKNNILLFMDNDGKYNLNNFEKIERSDFDKLLDELDEKIREKFNTDGCNYDGLVYLIGGINKGISLILTEDQNDAIKSLIEGLNEKAEIYENNIKELSGSIDKLEIKDIDTLTSLYTRYNEIIDKLENNKYLCETTEIMDAIDYNDIDNEKTIQLLEYILKYNVDIYVATSQVQETTETKLLEIDKNSKIDLTKPFEIQKDNANEEKEIDFEFPHFSKIESEDINDKLVDGVSEKNELESSKLKISKEDNGFDLNLDLKNVGDNDTSTLDTNEVDNFNEIDDDFKDLAIDDENDYESTDLPIPQEEDDDDISIDLPIKPDISLPENRVENNLENFDNQSTKLENENDDDTITTETLEHKNSQENIETSDNDMEKTYQEYNPFVINLGKSNNDNEQATSAISNNETDDLNELSNEDASTIDDTMDHDKTNEEQDSSIEQAIDDVPLRELLNTYGIVYADIENEEKDLVKGNISDYKVTLDTLKENNILSMFLKNHLLMKNVLLHSNFEIIKNVLALIITNLGNEDDGKNIIVDCIKTLPSIFVNEPIGNYQTFTDNLNSLKEWKLDIRKIYAFSKELLITNHDLIINNYEIVNNYGFEITVDNAKYLLTLPFISEKLDYYIETVAKDNMEGGTGKIFDGINYINLYPNKLNMVNSTVIERLIYSSETGKKIFGSKEMSLTGEITNLKVDILNIPNDYLENFFNNRFDYLDDDEIVSYENLIHETKNVDLVLDDILKKLEKYHKGLRYIIEGINISYNKVLRIYNILVNNNIDKNKALVFAVCYNSVITKEQYNIIKTFLGNLGGK